MIAPLLLLIPFVTATLLMVSRPTQHAKSVALISSLATLAVVFGAWATYHGGTVVQVDRDWVNAWGLRFVMGGQTQALIGDADGGQGGRVMALQFKDGTEIPTDLVVMAVGIRPNTELAEASGLHCQRGIVVTDTLQTTADPNLPEEMRWLAMYDEVGWDSLPRPFWERYAILADQRENALAFMDAEGREVLGRIEQKVVAA